MRLMLKAEAANIQLVGVLKCPPLWDTPTSDSKHTPRDDRVHSGILRLGHPKISETANKL